MIVELEEMNNEKLIYLSLGILAIIGISLTFVLVGKARQLDRQAARVEREEESILSPVEEIKEATPGAFPEASPSAREATPSSSEASPSAEF